MKQGANLSCSDSTTYPHPLPL